ncbi:MAG: hypothetical protein DKM50_01665 [Candidatus Margulisiibacteriota bacterium]|nr:MAG: hypothetical protein A2X43_13480 [Candidatus Margulisbacteria bacterium GWD2_39_127]OGI04731.1 MAG: hypothetical protein A2X42_10515 [Candidatus Margulisbacteria bacterium GWF2_38_17]OGI05676.1 MAG: hypothetical protein A2X41_03100 [Candidatus Margulisbacteria bacterium GWE2_39_32]PZM83610.1 MAG: hypothetical protein DKM50_01665 [Candidatus Margulisiibacteriota bacterium]HAR62028.1 hypothetical protein [Candidatus Margulisiibacteriota bacterium]
MKIKIISTTENIEKNIDLNEAYVSFADVIHNYEKYLSSLSELAEAKRKAENSDVNHDLYSNYKDIKKDLILSLQTWQAVMNQDYLYYSINKCEGGIGFNEGIIGRFPHLAAEDIIRWNRSHNGIINRLLDEDKLRGNELGHKLSDDSNVGGMPEFIRIKRILELSNFLVEVYLLAGQKTYELKPKNLAKYNSPSSFIIDKQGVLYQPGLEAEIEQLLK